MNTKLNFLLRTLLAVAVQDREAFVEKFGKLWEDYTGGCAFLIGNEGNGLRREVAVLRPCMTHSTRSGLNTNR